MPFDFGGQIGYNKGINRRKGVWQVSDSVYLYGVKVR